MTKAWSHGGRIVLSPVLIIIVGIGVFASPAAWAARSCNATQNDCDLADVITTSHIQIGGAGSLSGDGLNDPARLDDGTVVEADYDFTFDRSTGRLTVVVTNRSATTATLTGIFFNATPPVTGMSLLSHSGTVPWTLGFDRDRTDGTVNTQPQIVYLRGGAFGLFNVFLGNNWVDTQRLGGDPDDEILAGASVTYVLSVSGDLPRISACSFTSVGSLIPPGDKIEVGLGRFQGGVNDGTGFITPCKGGPLAVTLARADALPLDGQVVVRWSTASEVDNAGWRILRKDVRTGEIAALNQFLIPAGGSTSSGADYSFMDTTAVNGKKYHYHLEDFDLNGMNTIHRPLPAVPNPPQPGVRLLAPEYDGALAGGRFRWESDARGRFILQISGDPTFPERETLVLRTGTRTARGLTGREMDRAAQMSRAAGEGGIYWRVSSRDAQGGVAISQTFFAATP